jgi:hypothetical protein
MADPLDPGVQDSTTHRELFSYVIERRSSCLQRPSCELNGVLTLRGSARSVCGKIDRRTFNGGYQV